jgi:hypothetical protein
MCMPWVRCLQRSDSDDDHGHTRYYPLARLKELLSTWYFFTIQLKREGVLSCERRPQGFTLVDRCLLPQTVCPHSSSVARTTPLAELGS